MGSITNNKMLNENMVNVEEIFAMNVYTPSTMKERLEEEYKS